MIPRPNQSPAAIHCPPESARPLPAGTDLLSRPPSQNQSARIPDRSTVPSSADERLAGVLINTQPNFAWLSAGGTNGIDLSREAGAGTLLICRNGRRFV